ncbi:GNAT family N-acetyltransferase [Pontibacter sp. JAM-7]|uniref:GNAT family N-acetyltransferase n=1 Tax=Pontibacter sp. JAM-7 TaxID=3366581 RepID=UPI003AF5BE52
MTDPLQLQWHCLPFTKLSSVQVHALLSLRQQVFIIEQQCLYADADLLDLQSYHLFALASDGDLVACARMIPPAILYPEVVIGRVVTRQYLRGQGIGRCLMEQALLHADRLFPEVTVRVSAQTRLQAFYLHLGFVAAGRPYDDEGIEHIDMFRAKQTGV